MYDDIEYIISLPDAAAVNEDGEVCVGPVHFEQRLIRCGKCRHWITGIAYETVGRCTVTGRICSKDFFCGDSNPKEGQNDRA